MIEVCRFLCNNCKFSIVHFLIQIFSFIPKTTRLNIMVNSVSFFWWSKSPKGEAYEPLFFLVRQEFYELAEHLNLMWERAKENKTGKMINFELGLRIKKDTYIQSLLGFLRTGLQTLPIPTEYRTCVIDKNSTIRFSSLFHARGRCNIFHRNIGICDLMGACFLTLLPSWKGVNFPLIQIPFSTSCHYFTHIKP